MIEGFPELIPVRQELWSKRESDVEAAVARCVRAARFTARIKPGFTVAVAVGSRGVANIDRLARAAIATLKALGATPFIIPAMGSHGGGTAEGQIEILRDLGVTEAVCGAPIRSSMEVERIGETETGMPVYFDRNALGSDAIVAINRVKKHTDMTSPHESGLVKMLAIGLGKRAQAELIHAYGAAGLRDHIPPVARVMLARTPIALGIATIENGYEETAEVHGFEPNEIEAGERRLLIKNKRFLPRLPFDEIDVLIVDRMGKEISGTGMDTNVLGRIRILGEPEPRSPRVQWVAVLDLTAASHGNAIGVGLADVTTKRLVDKIDFGATYVNGITSGFFERAKVPITLSNDREAISTVFGRLSPERRGQPRVARIADTLHLDRFDVSRDLLATTKRPLEVLGTSRPLAFDPAGHLQAWPDARHHAASA
ncbi:MAG: DUF2088 domain-containing protein [Chloroflexota bacterium]|nr:MAG: DUF2088 domain-containing protein [Chloroflexota bacterium]